MSTLDSDDLKKRAVIEFSSISRRDIEERAQDAASRSSDPSVEEMKVRIQTARMHADKELEKFRQLVENFRKECSQLVLFKNTGESIKNICLDTILEETIEPILKGNCPYGFPEDLFRSIRKQFYKDLMDRYVK